MLLSFRNLVLLSAALCATAAFAEQRRVDVPFNFVVKNHAYQAGSYRVEVDSGRTFLTLANVKQPSELLMWVAGPGVPDTDTSQVSLTFDVIGSHHVLRTIRYGAFITPNLEGRQKQKVESTSIGE